jgi:hypothetical protein
MKKRLGGVKGAIAVAMSWAVVWGFPAFVIEGLANVGVELPITYTIDMWPQTLVMPGLLCGLLFFGVLAVAPGRRGIEDIPVASLSALGAVIGLVLGGVAVLALTGDAFPTLWVIGATTLLGAAAAAASALLFRYLARRQAPEGAEA